MEVSEKITMSDRIMRKDRNVYLIGQYTSQIVGNKLPSKQQVLKLLFFNIRELHSNTRDSASLTMEEVYLFWRKAQIPTRDMQHCIIKLESLHEEWKSLLKRAKNPSEFHKQKERNFITGSEDLFDIAHANAFEIMTKEQDKEFLLNQRKKGRVGSIICFNLDEDNTASREEILNNRIDKCHQELAKLSKYPLILFYSVAIQLNNNCFVK